MHTLLSHTSMRPSERKQYFLRMGSFDSYTADILVTAGWWQSLKTRAKEWVHIPSVKNVAKRLQKAEDELAGVRQRTEGKPATEVAYSLQMAKAQVSWLKTELEFAKIYEKEKDKNPKGVALLRKKVMAVRDKWFTKMDQLEDKYEPAAAH